MLICMQKINFITNFFLQILQKNSKLAILGMPGHTHLKCQQQYEETLDIYPQATGKRSTSSFTLSLRYYKDVVNLLFWVLWVCQARHTEIVTIKLWKTSAFICRQKTNFIPQAFLKILQRYAIFLFSILCVCLVRHTQNDSINLQKTSMFIGMPKINFNIH